MSDRGNKSSKRSLYGMLGSTTCSVTGNAMVVVLIPWLVLRETGSAAYAGFVNSAALIAAIFALLFGAAILDRWNRRNLSVGADLLSAAAVAAIPVADYFDGLSLPVIVVLVMIGAVFDVPGRAAREAIRPDIAKHSGVSLERTNALGEACDGIGAIAGPASTGAAVAVIGLSSSFWLAAAVLGAAGLVLLVVPRAATQHAAADSQRSGESYLHSASGGFKVVWRDPVLHTTATCGVLYGLFLSPIVLVLTAAFEADGRATALGGLLAAYSIGSISGSLAYAAWGQRLSRRFTLAAGLAGTTVGIAAMAALLGSYSFLVVAGIATGLFAGPLGPVFSVIIQQRTANEFRGRVLAAIGTLELSAAPLAMSVAGIVIEQTSPATTLYLVAAGSVIATLYTVLAPGLRKIEALDLVPAE